MKTSELEAKMRAGECFHALRVPPGAYIVLRVDGRSFSRWTEQRCDKPFDARFHGWMVSATTRLLQELQALYAYTESDEISVLLPAETQMFDREVEKLVSVSASIASSAFSIACGEFAPFDSRVWVGARRADVVDYFRWRQSDATRCALNGWCYWSLRNEGKSAREASAALLRASVSAKHELLFARGINFNDLPTWQRRGTGAYFGTEIREGVDPRDGRRTQVARRRIVVDEALPMKLEYSHYLRERLGSAKDESNVFATG